jgi:hypothetical protein
MLCLHSKYIFHGKYILWYTMYHSISFFFRSFYSCSLSCLLLTQKIFNTRIKLNSFIIYIIQGISKYVWEKQSVLIIKIKHNWLIYNSTYWLMITETTTRNLLIYINFANKHKNKLIECIDSKVTSQISGIWF